jgi:hypothetical protein
MTENYHHYRRFLIASIVLLLVIAAADPQAPRRRHNPGAPLMEEAPVIKPFSLSSACNSEIKTFCDLRSPFGTHAERCLDLHASQLSETCRTWHQARMTCKNEIATADFSTCESCKRFCGKEGLSLMHCLRRAGPMLHQLGITRGCTDTDFFRSITAAYRKIHAN